MSDATILPSYANNKFFFWNTRLANSLDNSVTATEVKVQDAPTDTSGNVTGAFLMAIKNVRSNPNRVELMWVIPGGVSGTTLTVVRGLRPSGLDYTTGSSSYVYDFDSGDEVFCAILPQDGELIRAFCQGIIASGGNQLMVGDGTAGTKTYGIYLDDGFHGILRSNGTLTEWSEGDGIWTAIADTSASVVTKVSSADTTASYLDNKIDVATDGELTKVIGNAGGNETLRLGLATTLTKAEMDALHTGISPNVTGTNLATLTAGPASNADALHTHADLGELSFTAYEAISAGNAVALLPVETKWYTQMTDANSNLGNSNTIRKKAVKYIPTASGTLTDWNFRAKEAVNGATALGDLVISIQTDDGGEPSGTAITNATATISQVTQRTWNTTFATRTATFAGSVSVTAGTTYWVVYECSATDATNYLIFGANDSYDENYLTFTQLTYNLDTATWGSSTTTSILFGWSNTTAVPFGYAICPTDANWGGRTWSFIGFAESAINAQASGTISTDYATLTGLTSGKDYYLSATPGEISTSATGGLYIDTTVPTTFCYKIGKALSSTQIKVQPGSKKVIIFQETILTANTTRNYILWFKPDTLKIYGQYNNPTIGYVTGGGTTDGNIRQSTTTGNSASSTSYSLFIGSNTDYMTGVDSAYTDVGFTYTLTATGSGANVLYFIEATA